MSINKVDLFSEKNITVLRIEMLKFAKLQLRDKDIAEDAVQEALTAAYLAKDKFSGLSQVKTWVFAILKNKIIDIIRANARNPILQNNNKSELYEEIDNLFNDKDQWHKENKPCTWSNPDATLKNEQFWVIFDK